MFENKILITARWRPRFEDREQCAARSFQFLEVAGRIIGLPGTWGACGDAKFFEVLTLDAVRNALEQSKENRTGQVFEKHGWHREFTFRFDQKSLLVDIKCGATVLANHVDIVMPDPQKYDISIHRRMISALADAFEPDAISVVAGAEYNRSHGIPFINWMIWGPVAIPAGDLPMVHSVEPAGNGTLVIISPERPYLDRREDKARFDAAAPIIRKYIPLAPPVFSAQQ
jgi:hypothetical protein